MSALPTNYSMRSIATLENALLLKLLRQGFALHPVGCPDVICFKSILEGDIDALRTEIGNKGKGVIKKSQVGFIFREEVGKSVVYWRLQ